MNQPNEHDRERKRILRRISLLTWGLIGAAVLLAVGGGALIAWLFGRAGLPFYRTWLILTILLLVVPGAVHLITNRRRPPGEG